MDAARCKTFSLSLDGDKAGPQRSLSNKSLVDNIFQPSANYTQFDPFGLPVPQQRKKSKGCGVWGVGWGVRCRRRANAIFVHDAETCFA